MTTPQNPPQQPTGPVPPGGAPAVTAPKVSFIQAITPDPAKAPPLEWAALVVGLILAVSAFLPWIDDNGSTFNGLNADIGSGTGYIVLAAGIGSAILGFFGLSRDSISLAVGQALLALIALIFTIIDITQGGTPQLGIWLAIITEIIVIILSGYNAFDAQRKGAKY